MDYYEKSSILHEKARGKIGVELKVCLNTLEDLSLVYTPGVARPCETICRDPQKAWDMTMKGNSVAVVTDGSAVLGLGNIGPMAALPVMEGKALLFKKFAKIDAWPICLDTQDTEEIIQAVRHLAPTFGGINLEDIAAPRCFEIEQRLQDLGIPVFHDDQHGTAIAVLAALLNGCRVQKRRFEELRVVICGAGAAGTALARLLKGGEGPAVKDVIVCDSKRAICSKRSDLTPEKRGLLQYTNEEDREGSIYEVMQERDVFIGVSRGGLLKAEDIQKMAKDPMIFALANPIPEILPQEAYRGGAAIVATGRSDFPNQVNNALVFPGIFRGALDARAKTISSKMKLAAAIALAESVVNPTKERLLPSLLDEKVAPLVAKAVYEAAHAELLAFCL